MNEILDIRGRIINRRRLKRKYLYRRIAVGIGVATIIAAIATTIGYAVNTTRADTVYSTYTYTVRTGDTLWDIAKKNVGNTKDIRWEMYDIQQMNHINVNVKPLVAGQQLTLVSCGE
ncbi:LysM peptidoglycan-binding domain-containing protein [Veillonella montpellierensis]|uniref:LysM peptidoglycan-binding domain-containing protein n=1 Tax=Veillonella montpellierensis TaxID=187328 RepID=UPI00056FB124|nr:LysM peptidoglycan-binding domain-containing protein [Veillonella montpellierensis]